MEDFFRRHDLQPLVQTEKLDAGKRVLQRVRTSTSVVRLGMRSCASEHSFHASLPGSVQRRSRIAPPAQADVLGGHNRIRFCVRPFSYCKTNVAGARGRVPSTTPPLLVFRHDIPRHACLTRHVGAYVRTTHVLAQCVHGRVCLYRTTMCNAPVASNRAWTFTPSSCARRTKGKPCSMSARTAGACRFLHSLRADGLGSQYMHLMLHTHSSFCIDSVCSSRREVSRHSSTGGQLRCPWTLRVPTRTHHIWFDSVLFGSAGS